MSLASDSILDRIRLKKHLSLWRGIALLSLVLVFVILILQYTPGISDKVGFSIGNDYIARVEIDEIILENHERDRVLESIREDENIQALIVYINSPGGTVVGGETLFESLRAIAEEKPVVAVMGSVAASGAYMTAVASDYIVARKGTITGSIGVIFQTAEVTELSDKIGINFVSFKSGKLKGEPSPFSKVTPAVTKAVQSTIDDTFSFFVDMVAERRNIPRGDVLRLADGRVFTGRQALENGLIDSIGGEKTALEWLDKEKNVDKTLEIRDIALTKDNKKFKNILNQIISGDADNLLSLSLFHNELLAIWEPGIPLLQRQTN